MNYKQIKNFSKELKKLLKKYKSLVDDLENFKIRFPEVDLYANKNFAILYKNERLMIIKARLFCRDLKGKTLRIIYAYYQNERVIEFIEIYFKGNKESENKEIIKEYLKNLI